MELLTWISPPLVGAFIGYTTNHVAIRMLFRPLRPWHILGVRVPMTPGVIPAKRGQLAENIGEMVGGQLLTGEDIRRALAGERFQNELRQLLDGRLDTLFNKKLGPLATLVPKRFRPYYKVGLKILRWRFLKHLHTHLDSDVVVEGLGRSLHAILTRTLSKNLDSLLPQENRDALEATLRSSLTRLLASPEVQKQAQILVNAEIDALLTQDKTPRDLLPKPLTSLLLDRLEAEAPAILHHLAGLLREEPVRQGIVQAATSGVQRLAASLGPMAALASAFLSPELINEKVREWLDSKEETLTDLLAGDTARQTMVRLLRDKADLLLDTPIRRLLAGLDDTTQTQTHQWLTAQATQLLTSPATAKTIADLLTGGIHPHTSRALAGLLAELFGPDAPEQAIAWASQELTAILRAPQTKRLLDTIAVELVEENLLSQPIGRLSTFLPKEVQQGFRDYLLELVSQLLIREVPGLLDTLDLKRIVVRKVNSLNLLRLEQLLLSIMEEQFRYINLMGGLLGFLIGLVNLIFLIP